MRVPCKSRGNLVWARAVVMGVQPVERAYLAKKVASGIYPPK